MLRLLLQCLINLITYKSWCAFQHNCHLSFCHDFSVIVRGGSFKRRLFAILATHQAITVPNAAPASTSVGKCTNRYSLENAISTASIRAGIPHFLLNMKTVTAPSKLTMECPDGNEKSLGTWTSSCTDGSSQQGRRLAAMFLRATFPRRKPIPMDTSMHPPIILVLGTAKSTAASNSQNMPWSPRDVMKVISPSTSGVCSSCSKYKKRNSILSTSL